MASERTKPGDLGPPLATTAATTSVQVPAESNMHPQQTTTTEASPKVPEKSNPPQTTTVATASTSAQASTAPESSTSYNTDDPIQLSNLQLSNNNNNDDRANRRLSDRALPPLPQNQTAAQVPSGGVITDDPPPEYMSLPNIPPGGGAARGPGGSNTRPENYVVPLQDLNESPDYIDCPHCRTRQKTIVQHQSSTETNMAAVACCLCCGILPGLIPFCCQWFYDVEHVCPRCVKVVARMPHDGRMEPVLPPKYQTSQFEPASGSGPAATTMTTTTTGNTAPR